MIGAGTGVLFSQLAILIQFGLWPINLIFIGGSLLIMFIQFLINDNKRDFLKPEINVQIWFIEILAFLSIIVVFKMKLF